MIKRRATQNYKQYYKSILRRIRRAKWMLEAQNILMRSHLAVEDKEDIYIVWWYIKEKVISC
jgi:hypothetical protein